MQARIAAAASTNRDFGNVAVIDDADGVVDAPNPFNLSGKTIVFVPANAAASSYKVQQATGGYDQAAYNQGTGFKLKDDDTTQIFLGFSFPFFGKTYQSLWVNSDGNITFEEGDMSSLDRSAGRLNGGPPRVAPMFTDLNPEVAQAGGGVHVLVSDTRVTVSWQALPTYVDTGTGLPQTFQVRLYPDGRIEMAYLTANPPAAVTGITPGRGTTAITVVDLASLPGDLFSGTVATIFSDVASVDLVAAAQKFYATHEDAYDYLAVFNSMGIQALASALAYESTVRSQGVGFGDVPVSRGAEFGSPSRLKAVMNMGPLFYYPDDINAAIPVRQPTGDTILTILAHEAGHLFLARVSVADPGDPTGKPMLGRSLVHWSFDFNADASYLEGSLIQDLGAGASPRFRTGTPVQRYSALDQYLMGLRPKEEVGPMFFVSGSPYAGARPPEAGVSMDGTRRDFTIDDVIAIAGRRIPDASVAQRRFRMGFVLVNKAGQDPPADSIAKVQTARQAFETFFASGTGGRGFMSTSLNRMVQLSAAPAAGVLVNGKGKMTITLASPPASTVAFSLSEPAGLLSVPDLVMVPAGASSVSFTVTGAKAGVAEVSALPASSTYESAYARVQVRTSPIGLTLQLLTPALMTAAANNAPNVVSFKVVDENLLPYLGVPVTATVSGGQLAASTVTTDENGVATFQWTGSSAAATLQAVIANTGATPVTVTLSGRPVTSAAAIGNAASGAPGITPGSFASIFGSSLTGGVTASIPAPLPYGYSQVQVLINGLAAQLSYVGDSQINFVVPWAVTGTSASVEIRNPVGQFTGFSAAVKPVLPGIFVLANQFGAVLVSGSSVDTSARAAKVGNVVEIYCTGLGPVVASKNYPGLQETATLPRVFIGGVEASNVVAVLSPQYPGLYQVNAVLSPGTPSGKAVMTMTVGTVTSNQVQINVE